MAHILVTGGAGYIGAVTAAQLRRKNYSVTVLDNLSTGHRAAVSSSRLIEADLGDERRLEEVFSASKFDAVVHFAAHCRVEESVRDPRKYYEENVGNGLKLFAAMLAHGIRTVIFSSSCAVYGHPTSVPISEKHPLQPINPYGESKLFLERILQAYAGAYGMRWISLRYFNACGASLDGMLGESHQPETHLIPLVLRAVADNGYVLTVNGDDYPTSDGTCIRDYIHVEDLAAAHLAALRRLFDGADSAAYNVGTGQGWSVQQVIDAAEHVTGRSVRRRVGSRRQGDPPALVADASRAREDLEWAPDCSNLLTILKTAWQWFQTPRY